MALVRVQIFWALLTVLLKFRFVKEWKDHISVELEFYLCRDGRPVPEALAFLRAMNGESWTHEDKSTSWTYELGACQVELRVGPCATLEELRAKIVAMMKHGREVAGSLGLELVAMETAPRDITLEHFPSPRYDRLVGDMSKSILRACCRVAGMHIHVGCGGWSDAIAKYKALRKVYKRFIRVDTSSARERLRLFRVLCDHLDPPVIENIWDLIVFLFKKTLLLDVGDWWSWIRISSHGTVEDRTHGATDDIELIMSRVEETCRALGIHQDSASIALAA